MLNIETIINESQSKAGPENKYKDSTIDEIITEDSLQELLESLVGKQRQINTEKAMQKAYNKTNQQVSRYLNELFANKCETEVRRIGAFLMLYVQKFAQGATFLGFTRFLKSNRFRDTDDITNEYIGLIMKEEMNGIYDVLEQFNQHKEQSQSY